MRRNNTIFERYGQENLKWNKGMFNSKEEAIQDAIETYKENNSEICKIFLGKCETIPLPSNILAEDILNNLDEQYYALTGYENENYIYENVNEKQEKWLEDKISEVIIEFHKMIGIKSDFYNVIEEEKIDLNEYKRGENK